MDRGPNSGERRAGQRAGNRQMRMAEKDVADPVPVGAQQRAKRGPVFGRHMQIASVDASHSGPGWW